MDRTRLSHVTEQNGRHKSQPRTQSRTHTQAQFVIRHFLHHKITISQKTSYRDTKLQISENLLQSHRTSVLTTVNGNILGCQRFQGRKGGQIERRGEQRHKRGGFMDISDTYRCPGIIGIFPGLIGAGRMVTWPYQKPG